MLYHCKYIEKSVDYCTITTHNEANTFTNPKIENNFLIFV